MIEFISLDEKEQEAPILPDYPHSISNIKLDTKIIDGVIEPEEVEGICADYTIISIDKIESVDNEDEGIDHICIKDDCDVSKYYGCTGGDDGFQKDNLFSELVDEYQRTVARINLGIADEYALKWGNIKGNLSNQKDLYTFVTDSIAFDINKVIDEINLKLAQWACEIEIRFKNKADVFSPNLLGIPTTTLPLMTDKSNRIASTEWVTAKIEAASIDDNVKAISVEPEYMSYGDPPTDVKVTWEYNKDVDEQSINGTPISKSLTEYTFGGVTTSMVITLKYKYGEITAARVVTFDIKYPIFYGTSPDFTKNKKTIDNSFTIDAKASEYMYVMIPNGLNAVLAVSSIIGGFKLLGTQDIYGNIYYIFKSANAGLGETTIEIMNQGNFGSEDFDTTSLKEILATKADKYAVYDKTEIDTMFDEFALGEGGLKNYYTKTEVDSKIPDVSGKADKSELATKTSDLINDSGYITEIPKEYVTETELLAKKYLTVELEPAFNASAASSINQANINSWNAKVDKIVGMGLSEQNYTQIEKAKLQGLTNYSDSDVRKLISDLTLVVNGKPSMSDIPDISNKADIDDIPTKTSQLLNDSGFLTTLPGGLITEEILNSKGYLTSFTETDPTVPAWAKLPSKPTYTLVELGAEEAGAAAAALLSALGYTDQQINGLVDGANSSYNTLKKIGDAIIIHSTDISDINSAIRGINTTLTDKADKTELFSKDYNDLINTPSIPSLDGYATELYVTEKILEIPGVDLTPYALKTEIPDISNKVDKVIGMGLTTNDFTNPYRTKLDSLINYNDSELRGTVADLQEVVTHVIPLALYNATSLETYFGELGLVEEYLATLMEAKAILVEYASGKYVTIYNKTLSDNSDISGFRTIDMILYGRYSNNNDIMLHFHLYNGEASNVSYTKTVVPTIINGLTSTDTTVGLSAAQGKVLLDRIIALEEVVNNIGITSSIILE